MKRKLTLALFLTIAMAVAVLAQEPDARTGGQGEIAHLLRGRNSEGLRTFHKDLSIVDLNGLTILSL